MGSLEDRADRRTSARAMVRRRSSATQSAWAARSGQCHALATFSLPFCPVADGQIVAALITGLATTVAAAWAALEARAANRNTKVVDERAQKTTNMDVARQMFAMACSDNDKESIPAAYVLKEMKDDFISDPVLRKFVIRAATALNASNIQAYHRGATKVTSTSPPGATAPTQATVSTS